MKLGFDGIIDDHTVDSALLHVQMNRFQFIFGRNYSELHATLFLNGYSGMNMGVECRRRYLLRTYDNTLALEIDASQTHNLMRCIEARNGFSLLFFLLRENGKY